MEEQELSFEELRNYLLSGKAEDVAEIILETLTQYPETTEYMISLVNEDQ